MIPVIRDSLKKVLGGVGIGVTTTNKLAMLRRKAAAGNDLELICALPPEHGAQLLKHLRSSKAQLRQDLFALSQSNFKRSGYFVEFGATNGVSISNTHLLEKEFAWAGILAEPAKCWHDELRKNRSCNIETNCVWGDSKTILKFNEVGMAELSTIDSYSNGDALKRARKGGRTYSVQSISLQDMLEKHNAPKLIDYLSVDTEGSELDILKAFDFTRYDIRVVSVEHNYTAARKKIYDLMFSNGYLRVHEDLSDFDDWYVLQK